jgi:DNA-binding transcriptional ArsR family regulator
MAPAAVILKAFTHPVRLQILTRIAERPSSPTEMAADFGVDLRVVAYHARCLEDRGLAQVVKRARPKSQRRGPIPKLYAANKFELPDDEWMTLPAVVREALTIAALRELASWQHSAPPEPDPEMSEEVGLGVVRRELAALVGVSSDSLLRLLARTVPARTSGTA